MNREEFKAKFKVGDKIRKHYWDGLSTITYLHIIDMSYESFWAEDENGSKASWLIDEKWELYTEPDHVPDVKKMVAIKRLDVSYSVDKTNQIQVKLNEIIDHLNKRESKG